MRVEQVDWAREKMTEIKIELNKTADGREFVNRVTAMLAMDRHWVRYAIPFRTL